VADAFVARSAILAFKENNSEEPSGKRGALIFTGAMASTRGNVVTGVFAATRAMSEPGERIWEGKYSRCPCMFVSIYFLDSIFNGPRRV
jgi:hypothetical protein